MKFDTSYAMSILLGMNKKSQQSARDNGMHIYGGTVPSTTVQSRREKNRVARKSRRINRKRSQ